MTKYKILEILRNNSGNFVSGEILSEKLSVSRTSVWKGIKSLKEKGYKIEGVNNKGYRLTEDCGDTLSQYEIKKSLDTKELGKNIYYFETIDSTNLYAKKNIEKLNHGDVVIADEQLRGRGRMDKVFYSPKESGIYLSLILKENIFYDSVKLFSIAVFISACHAIERVTGMNVELTWNDIRTKGKKVCGILSECSIEGETGRIEYLIAGIGINVNNSDFPKILREDTTSLKLAFGKETNRKQLISVLMEELEEAVCKKIFEKQKNIFA